MRMTLKAKLVAAFAVMVALSAAGTLLGIRTAGQFDAQINAIVEQGAKREQLANELLVAETELQRQLRHHLLLHISAEKAEVVEAIVATRERLTAIVDEMEALLTGLGDAEGVEDMEQYDALRQTRRPMTDQVLAFSDAGDVAAAVRLLSGADLLLSLNAMVEKLRGVMNEVSQGSRAVANGAGEMASTAAQLSQGATEQASATEEASSAMEQMAANIRQTAHNATETEAMAVKSAADARASGKAVSEAVEAMRTIADRIMGVQEVARQTDLLAFNAAVEAAQAGEHGRGFAVVASEVHKPGERSQTAGGEVSALSGCAVQAAEQAAEQAGRRLDGLVPRIERTSALVSQISGASQMLATGAAQVNFAIQQLDKVIQENTTASEEMSATAESLSGQAGTLRATMGFFRTRSGSAGPSMAPSAEMRGVAAPSRRAAAPSQVSGGGFEFDLATSEDEFDRQFVRGDRAA